MVRARGFTLIEAAVALAIAGIITAIALDVYGVLVVNMKRTRVQSQLSAASSQLDEEMRVLTMGLGGGALRPGHLVYLADNVDAHGSISSDRLTLFRGGRAGSTGVVSTSVDPPTGGTSPDLSFDAALNPHCAVGGIACPIVDSTCDAAGTPTYTDTSLGTGMPALLIAGGKAAMYTVTAPVEVHPDNSCTVKLTLALGEVLTMTGDLPAIFSVTRDEIALEPGTLPQRLTMTRTAVHHAPVPTFEPSEIFVLAPGAFDFQVKLAFDASPGNGIIDADEWLPGTSGCSNYPQCITTTINGASMPDLRMIGYGIVIGVRIPVKTIASTAMLEGSYPISHDEFLVRAVEGKATFRNAAFIE